MALTMEKEIVMYDAIDWLREQYELRLIRQRENRLFRAIVVLGIVQVVLFTLIAMKVI